jgi:hypothetical protein
MYSNQIAAKIILTLLQEEANATQILLLQVRNIAAQKARALKKQKKMTDYFKI